MSWVIATVKVLTGFSAVFGLTSFPFFYSFEQEIPRTSEKEEAMKLGEFSDRDAVFSLQKVKSVNRLFTENKKILSFEDLGMKWGEEELNKNDILFSPCQDGNFYLMKHVGSNKYTLKGSKEIWVTTPKCYWDKNKYEHLPHINLSWVDVAGRNSTLSQITVGSCALDIRVINWKGEKGPKLIVTCYDFLMGRATIYGVYGAENHKSN